MLIIGAKTKNLNMGSERYKAKIWVLVQGGTSALLVSARTKLGLADGDLSETWSAVLLPTNENLV